MMQNSANKSPGSFEGSGQGLHSLASRSKWLVRIALELAIAIAIARLSLAMWCTQVHIPFVGRRTHQIPAHGIFEYWHFARKKRLSEKRLSVKNIYIYIYFLHPKSLKAANAKLFATELGEEISLLCVSQPRAELLRSQTAAFKPRLGKTMKAQLC